MPSFLLSRQEIKVISSAYSVLYPTMTKTEKVPWWMQYPNRLHRHSSDVSLHLGHQTQNKIDHLAAVPTFFGMRDCAIMQDNFSMDGVGVGDVFGMIQVHDIYDALYFWYYYISPTSHHQTLDPRGWGPLKRTKLKINSVPWFVFGCIISLVLWQLNVVIASC